MSPSMFFLWALIGWCGNEPWRIILVRPPFNPDPAPAPDPQPHWLIGKILGVAAGILGGLGYTLMFDSNQASWNTPVLAAASALGAFAVSRFVTDIYQQATSRNLKRG